MSRLPSSINVQYPLLKDYRLTEKLGTGTFATVYKAHRKNNPDEVVAVKCIERSRLNHASTENLFTEIEVMKSLHHNHIVELKTFEWDDKYIYLIVEYCNKGDLSAFIKSRTVLREKDARKFLRQLALALQFLHERNIAHMDLKPQNLLLAGNGQLVLKVADFGMAQHVHAGDYLESFRGSPLYMAPEIMLGHSYGAKVDLWSVGVILYETLFGMAPFASKTFEELEKKIIDTAPVKVPSNPIVSPECKDLLHKLLERDQDKRISFEEFFIHPFIDLEHMPRPTSLHKARDFVVQAVADDTRGNIKSAIANYTQAIEYFIPAIEFEQDLSTREALRNKIEQYIERAELLKETLRSKKPFRHRLDHPESLLECMKSKYPCLKSALTKASMAEQEEINMKFKSAFDLYKEAVEVLIPIAEVTNVPAEKKLLKSEIKAYLDRAEEVLLLSKQKSKFSLFGHSTSSVSEPSDSRCRLQ